MQPTCNRSMNRSRLFREFEEAVLRDFFRIMDAGRDPQTGTVDAAGITTGQFGKERWVAGACLLDQQQCIGLIKVWHSRFASRVFNDL